VGSLPALDLSDCAKDLFVEAIADQCGLRIVSLDALAYT
jgi:hypothetical protein